MDYRMIAENMWSDIYEKHYDESENIRDKVIEKAESIAAKPVVRKSKKRGVIPAVIAAAAVITVSAGAAMDWDINTLFGNYNDVRQDISAQTRELTNWYLERDRYDTDGSELYKRTDNYDDILSKIVHPVDKLCEYDNMDIYIHGYAYDGYILEMYYDVIPKNVPLFADLNDYYAWMYSYEETADKHYGGQMKLYAVEGNKRKYMYRFGCRFPEGADESLFLLYPHDLHVLEVPPEEWGRKFRDCAFTVEKPDIPEYVRELYPDITIETTDGRQAVIEYLLISPISVEFGGRMRGSQEDFFSLNPTPLYIEYDDGEVLDLSSWTSSGFNGASGNFDDARGFYKYNDTNGNILDLTHIKSIRLFDRTVELR